MNDRYRPNVTLACIIHCQNHYVLVEESINGEIKFNQPAGHLEANESLTQACIREVKEETGLCIQPQKLITIQQYSASSDLAFLRFTYAVELKNMEITKPEDPQIIKAHWLTLSEIYKLKNQLRSPLVIDSIEQFLQGKGTNIDLIDSSQLI